MAVNDPQSRPPPFDWESWYEGIGGRSIRVPEVEHWFRKIFEEQMPNFAGPVAAKRREFGDPAAAARAVKASARAAGADLVGTCRLAPEHVYRGREVSHTHAIALAVRMRWRAFQTVPSPESAAEQARVYYELGRVCLGLAGEIRGWGYDCEIGHPVGDSNLLHLPIAIEAGLGELGRHGSLIHPELGPLLRLASLAVSLPMACDGPIDAGIGAFCDSCMACRKFCPPKAIPDDRDPGAGKDPQGNDRYRIDTGRCFPYFARNYYCAICLPVCVYNHKEWARDFEGHKTKLFPEVVMNEPPPVFDGIPETERHAYPKLGRPQ
ncbi:MAG: hypothetical protein EA425_06500 [Puniceicoccaceae bacterium]|nr:MAG: hypothetical protein EA425_06500 [Puniceicoccaceae bacterium]